VNIGRFLIKFLKQKFGGILIDPGCEYEPETEPQHKNIFSTNLQTEHRFTLNEFIKLF